MQNSKVAKPADPALPKGKCVVCNHDLHCTWCPEFTCSCFADPTPVPKEPVAAPVDQQEGQSAEQFWRKRYGGIEEKMIRSDNDPLVAIWEFAEAYAESRASLASSPQPAVQEAKEKLKQAVAAADGTSVHRYDELQKLERAQFEEWLGTETCEVHIDESANKNAWYGWQARSASVASSSPESSQPALTAEEFAERCGILPIHRPVAIRFAEAYLGLATASSQGVNEELLGALKALVIDVQGYEAWQRLCHALDVAVAAIARAEEPGC